MNEIDSVINSFIKPYMADDDIQAAILTGSYAQGNHNGYSDIDIFIISSDEMNWRERGNKILSNYLIEYFINPSKKIFQEMENQSKNNDRVTASILAKGIKLFDKTGILKTLTEKAMEIMKIPLIPISNNDKEYIKYFTYYYYDQLKRAYENNLDEFMYLYYTFLEHIIYSYGKYNGLVLAPRTKIYQYVFEESYKINNDLKKIEDKEYLDLLKKCMINSNREVMYKNITNIKEYILKDMGGFSIDGWKIRTEIK